VLPLYILDDVNSGPSAMGAASRWWLNHSLHSLNSSLDHSLHTASGDALDILPELADQSGALAVYWNRCYEPWRIQRDRLLKEKLQALGIEVRSFNASLLWEPWQILKSDQTPYKMFTPYYRKGCLQAPAPVLPVSAPPALQIINLSSATPSAIDHLNLLPGIAWDQGFAETWTIGEAAAQQRLHDFLDGGDEGLNGYRVGRNIPDRNNVSRLSPHLHFGEISPRQAWHQAQQQGAAAGLEDDLDCFLSELGWREFSYYLLYHNPDLVRVNIQRKFDRFPWSKNQSHLRAWQQGNTGFPLIDAGMRELWQTGYMHNRVRMVTASFLVKNLMLHWHEGEDWFWNCLVDADLASNSASWQWVAGCGADAAPYFRIFNPVTQSEKFDPRAIYIRKYVPELSALPDRYIHNPGGAPAHILAAAGVRLGENYPQPIVDLKSTREAALAAFKSL
jgi:deoxyribodipyrimidine photo-lyase